MFPTDPAPPQQNGDRSCSQEAIGGAHYGPVQVYLSKVADAATADGSAGWFKIFADTWAKNPSGGSGDDDFWGTKDLNYNCTLLTYSHCALLTETQAESSASPSPRTSPLVTTFSVLKLLPSTPLALLVVLSTT